MRFADHLVFDTPDVEGSKKVNITFIVAIGRDLKYLFLMFNCSRLAILFPAHCNCTVVVEKDSGKIKSPNHPQNYHNNACYVWNITVPEWMVS